MPLNIELRPHEKIFINGAVIANGADRARISLLNDAAILREKDILTEEKADTPCKRVYLAIQLMYMDPASRAKYQIYYEQLTAHVRERMPDTTSHIAEIDADLATGHLYQAMRTARKLIDREQEFLNHAPQPL
ncbi:MAG: flagellar biosynthesis repressor FlbT [Chromatiaceae bacterium]|nr:flagellar biosynthesis repressor FlbT [Hydrogenophilales bacterium]MBP6582635.1 flagellar biosynthesis repressor FlbT [Chromatiaceae bacterium]MBP6807149.1 flagellar biosynthesis repressor FlbT [Chromatiaceae bacterium]